MCQVQTRCDAEHALSCGAEVIVAQGAEAGGHGERRSTFTLVPEIADLIAAKRLSEPSSAPPGELPMGGALPLP